MNSDDIYLAIMPYPYDNRNCLFTMLTKHDYLRIICHEIEAVIVVIYSSYL